MRKFAVSIIELYRNLISPYWQGSCRHSPTCSLFSQDAILRYGVLRGGWLSVKRISSCHPFGRKGFDPVP